MELNEMATATTVIRRRDRSVRRATFAACVLAVWAACFVGAGAARADQAAARYMDQVARELVAAMRTRSPDVIASVMRRRGDVAWIGSSALGNYRPRIAATDRNTYLGGMVRFIARYSASQAPSYPVASYQVLGTKPGPKGLVYVDTRVQMTSGTSYDVRWLLAKSGGAYKVRDAEVMGFWMTPLLRKIFEDYIGENGGRVKALVTALNR